MSAASTSRVVWCALALSRLKDQQVQLAQRPVLVSGGAHLLHSDPILISVNPQQDRCAEEGACLVGCKHEAAGVQLQHAAGALLRDQ